MDLRRTVGATLLAVFAVAARPAAASPDEQDWAAAFAAYTDHAGGARALLLLDRQGTTGVAPLYRLALADADMRAGKWHSAATAFEQVSTTEAGFRWGALAELGLGWIALRSDDLPEARVHLTTALKAGGDVGQLATLLVGLVDGLEGAETSAASFDRIAADPTASAALRLVSLLAKGYTQFWRGDDEGAIESFERVAASPPDGPLADDARYAAARAGWRAGDESDARGTWRELAKQPRTRGGEGISRGLLDLEPRALLAAGFRRFRRLPLGHSQDEVVALLDGDGGALARHALGHFVGSAAAPAPHTSADAVPTAAHAPAVAHADPESARRTTPASPLRTATSPTRWVPTLTMLVVLLLGLGWCIRRFVGA